MSKLTKIPLPSAPVYWGVQCPKHAPSYATEEHSKCLKEWSKEARKKQLDSLEYKQIVVLNRLIEYLNKLGD